MSKQHIDELVKLADEELASRGYSRRDFMKLVGVGGAAAMMSPTVGSAATKAVASSAKGKIVIVGGGLAGISTAALLSSKLSNPDITIIDPDTDIHYQPGYTLIASGVYNPEDVVYKKKDFIPDGVKWIQKSVSEFDPDNNAVVTNDGEKVGYDFLVVATGIELNFEAIEGMSRGIVGSNGIGSVYTHEGATKTWGLVQDYCQKGGEGLFTHPNTPIKCGGAPKKIQFLVDSYARKIGTRDKINTTFLPNGGAMFGVKEYNELIFNLYEEKGLNYKFKHNLVAIDPGSKKATFAYKEKVKTGFDEILQEDVFEEITKQTTMDYDFIHVTPPQKAPDALKNSPLSWKKGSAAAGGWMELEKETLRHPNYSNVFGLGDVAGIPMGKTGGSVRKQYAVVAENLVSAMEGKALSAKYDGYTVCPLITEYGKVAMLEFDWSATPKPSFPLDPAQDRWVYWVMKVYMLKPMTMYGMLSGKA